MLGIGFDSGGSRTTFALDRGAGPEAPAAHEIAASIAGARDADALAATVAWICDVLRAQTDAEMCAWVGAAGFSAATAHAISAEFTRPLHEVRHWLTAHGRHCTVYLANDAVAILKAPPLLGHGIAAIVGTGSVVMGAHAACPARVVRRGGHEWLVSDEGSGVWMTLECIRLLLADIEAQGPGDHASALLDRLARYLRIEPAELAGIPVSHRALATIDLVARRAAAARPDTKRFLAGFVYPDLFDLAASASGARPAPGTAPAPGAAPDPIAAAVLRRSAQTIAAEVCAVCDELVACLPPGEKPGASLPLVVGGRIAANPHYLALLREEVASACPAIASVAAIGDAGGRFAALALTCLRADDRARLALTRSFDPLHPVVKLL